MDNFWIELIRVKRLALMRHGLLRFWKTLHWIGARQTWFLRAA